MGLVFNGSNSRVDCGNDTSIEDIFFTGGSSTVGGGTVSAWILPTGYGGAGEGRVVDKADAPGLDGLGWSLAISSVQSNRLLFGHTGVSLGAWVSPANSILTNNIYHVAVAYNANSVSNDPILYINGVSVTVTELATPTLAMFTDASVPLSIGNRSASTDRGFAGFIGDVRLYDDFLTEDEVVSIYTSKGHDNVKNVNMKARWFMNESPQGVNATTPNSIPDLTENANTGSPVNSPQYTGTPLNIRKRTLRNT